MNESQTLEGEVNAVELPVPRCLTVEEVKGLIERVKEAGRGEDALYGGRRRREEPGLVVDGKYIGNTWYHRF